MKTTDRYVLMLAGIQIIISLVIFGLGMDGNQTLQNGVMVATSILTIYICHVHLRDFRDLDNNGFLTIGEGLTKGFGLGWKSGSITAVYYYLYYKFLNPEFIDKMRILQEMEMEEKGLNQKEIEQAMQFTDMFSNPGMLAAGSFIGSVFFIFILSLISSAILKKENPDSSWK
ncbi:MAG: DUF4199 domain-containing protein [Bacteroidota bacterium]